MNKISTLIILAAVVVLAGILFFGSTRDDFNLPTEGEAKKETITSEKTTKEIMVTNGIRHSVPLKEIITLLSKDGIPSIDNPKFVKVREADDWLKDNEPGVAFSDGDIHRFYPYQILVWHELVNDVINNKQVLITYCPLCLTGYVFDPLVKGKRVQFGTSGKLWKSNLVMYDRKTNSLWSQVLGEAIAGEMTGTKLKVMPSDQILYGNWKKSAGGESASGGKYEVLSRDTGAFRVYGSYPYKGDYSTVDDLAISIAKPKDSRLPNNAFVFGIIQNGKAKAYSVEAVKKKGEVIDNFGGQTFILRHDKELDVVRIFRKLPDGSEERINPISGFWFSWSVVHPGTELYK